MAAFLWLPFTFVEAQARRSVFRQANINMSGPVVTAGAVGHVGAVIPR